MDLFLKVIVEEVEEYIKKNYRKIKFNIEIYFDYKIFSFIEYIVICFFCEGNSILFEIKVNVFYVEIVKRICKNWNKNVEMVYRLFFENLV